MTANRYFAFALTLAAGCAPAYAPSPAEASRDELAIYTVVIDSVLETAGDPFVVMAESTAVVGLSEQELARWSPGRDSTFPTAAFADLVVRNRTPVRVPTRTLTDREIRTFRPADFHPEFVPDASGNYVLRGFEPVRRLHILSRPGVDAERRRAVIFAGSGCGGLCGVLQLVQLTRAKRGWGVVKVDTVMQS